jgi:putative restriction endonuclease
MSSFARPGEILARSIRSPTAFVGITDWDWFDYLRVQPAIDEVNFWQPSGGGGFAALQVGEPFLFKLHSPRSKIVGGGFFAHYSRLPVSLAWEAFGTKNGAPSLDEMRRRVERYRRISVSSYQDYEIGCILLEQPFFLEDLLWLDAPDWKAPIQRGRRYLLDEEPGQSLWTSIEQLARPLATADAETWLGEPVAPRYGAPSFVLPRLGQGSFQVAVLDAYGRRCAITGAKVVPALEAGHIRPYSEGGEHRVDNGLLLRRDVHALFDRGYISVTPAMEILVSKRLRAEFNNGEEYVAMNGALLRTPIRKEDRPNPDFLDWHNQHRFVA